VDLIAPSNVEEFLGFFFGCGPDELNRSLPWFSLATK